MCPAPQPSLDGCWPRHREYDGRTAQTGRSKCLPPTAARMMFSGAFRLCLRARRAPEGVSLPGPGTRRRLVGRQRALSISAASFAEDAGFWPV